MSGIKEKFQIFFNSKINKEKKEEIFKYIWNNYSKRISYVISNIIPFRHIYFEDIFQEVMMKIYSNLEKYNPLYSFKSWIFTIARNHCIDYLKRKNEKIYSNVELEKTNLKSSRTPDEVMIDKEEKNNIDSYFKSLPERERTIAYLRFYEELKIKEISDIMNIKQNTIKSILFKIRNNFKIIQEEIK